MARLHGRRGRVYLGIASSSASAEPLPFTASWSINHSTDKADVTAFEDGHKTYVSGMPEATGQFAGFYSDASAGTYTAAIDGAARKFYLYPSTSNTGQYFFGTIIVDFNVDGSVSGPVAVSASWAAASAITKVG